MKTIGVTNKVFLLGLLFAFLDQLSKVLVQKSGNIPISVNDGIAFSIEMPYWLQIGLTAVLLVLIIFYAKRLIYAERLWKRRNKVMLGLSLVFGGGLGNFMDRVNLGHVIDFIDVGFWPVFNLADSFITVGAVLLALMWMSK